MSAATSYADATATTSAANKPWINIYKKKGSGEPETISKALFLLFAAVAALIDLEIQP